MDHGRYFRQMHLCADFHAGPSKEYLIFFLFIFLFFSKTNWRQSSCENSDWGNSKAHRKCLKNKSHKRTVYSGRFRFRSPIHSRQKQIRSRQKQIPSRQKQFTHGKSKSLTAKTNSLTVKATQLRMRYFYSGGQSVLEASVFSLRELLLISYISKCTSEHAHVFRVISFPRINIVRTGFFWCLSMLYWTNNKGVRKPEILGRKIANKI